MRGMKAAVGLAVLLALAHAPPARAHSFLVRSSPEAGARLGASPPSLQLYFSEPFVGGSERVSIRRFGGGTLALPRPSARGSAVQQPLPQRLKGIYVVHWRVLSDDGHVSLGEFAFAVGSSAALPSLKASTAKTSWSQVATTWLVLAGLALALGGLASERFVWRRTPLNARALPAAPAGPGVVLATVGLLLQLVLLAGDRRGGGFASGLHSGALGDALGTRPGKLTLATLIALALSGVLVPLRWLRLTAIVPLLGAVVFIAERGHSGTSGYGWAAAADSIHLATVAVWLGALAHLVLIVARAEAPRPTLVEGACRFSRFALPTALVVLATGILTAIPEFRSVGAVVSSGYGQTLLVKAGLIGIALVLAWGVRQRALPANPRPRLPLLRRLTLAEATTLAVVLVVAAVLVNAAPPRAPATPQATSAVLGPPPVAGPGVRLADLAGQLVVGLTAGARELQFTVVPPGSQPPGELELTADARLPNGKAVDLYPRPCGSSCFSIRFRLRRGTNIVSAKLSSSKWQGGEARFAVSWPLSAAQPVLLQRVVRRMRAIPRLLLTEQVTSGPGAATKPAQYALTGRYLIAQELYRAGAVDVRPIAYKGGLTELAFALPGSSIWYRMTIDRSYRIRRETIVSPGHLIRRTFAYPRARAATRSNRTSTATPRPPNWPFVLAREDDDLAVGLAARPNGPRLALVITVLDDEGHGATGLQLAFRLHAGRTTTSVQMTSCGAGCYRADAINVGRPRLLTLRVERLGRAPALLRFPFPQRWPPPSATALVRRATAVFRHLHSFVFDERLASSARAVVRDRWTIVAPDRATYKIVGGPEAIIIGSRRWDRDPGKRWQASQTSPLQEPTPFWGTPPAGGSLLGSKNVRGRPAWLVSFLDPGGPAWFELAIDKKTLRTLELWLVTTAHFMHHRYGDFNRPLAIRPPR